jgi:hypothetical protein
LEQQKIEYRKGKVITLPESVAEMELRMLKAALKDLKNHMQELKADATQTRYDADPYTRGIAQGMEIVLKSNIDSVEELLKRGF